MIVERNNARPARWVTWLGLVLVPVLIAGGLFAGTWNGNPRHVDAAIVNLDEPVTIDGQYIPLGRQLTAALVDSDRVDNLTWLQANEDEARTGLATGRYAAMVVIPSDFSAAATSYGGEAGDARRATIQVETSPVAGIADATLGKVVAHEAATTLNQTLTSTYLDRIYLGFNDMGGSFVTMADGAAELADGAGQLADGVDELADGVGQLTDGTGELADGTGQLADGLARMARETKPLPTGARQLADGVADAADGASQLWGGATQLADGLQTMAAQTEALPAGAQQLADGSAGLSSGLGSYVTGVNQLVDQTLAALPQQAQLAAGVAQLSAGATGLDGGLAAYQAGLRAQAKQSGDAASALRGLLTAIGGGDLSLVPDALGLLQSACGMTVPPAEVGVYGPVCVGSLTGAATALDGAAAGLDQADPGTGQSLRSGAGALASGLAAMSDGLSGGELPNVEETTNQLEQLKAGGPQLAAGASDLASGLATFAEGMPPLVAGIGQSADGAGQLSDGLHALAGGLGQASAGADRFADGLPALVAGIEQASSGAVQLADGTDELHSGVQDLDDGVTQLADGSRQLADGTRELADGIAEGMDQLPSYPEADRQNLAEVVSAPISTENLQGSVPVGIGWGSLLMVLALWIGALATYVVVRAVGSRLLGSARSSAYLVVEALLPGVIVVAVQAVAVTVIGQVALQLPFGKLLGMLGLMLVAGLAFVAVNHALVAWFGGTGRLVSVAFAVLGLATVLTSSEPAVFAVLRVFSPITPAMDAIRALLTESSGVATNLFLMVAWLIAGLAASAIAIVRNRTTSISALLAEHGVTG